MRLPARLLRRNKTAHKGEFGHVFIIAGCGRFSGAAVLCAEAAMRSGAGLVTLGIPGGINAAVIKIKPKEVMTLPLPQNRQGALSPAAYKRIKDFISRVDVVALGPGLSRERSAQALARKVTAGANKPIVIDADGLNALAGHMTVLRDRIRHCEERFVRRSNLKTVIASPSARNDTYATILTPHPGEMARLVGVSIEVVQANRSAVTKEFVRKYKVTVVLKGHRTVVAGYPSGFYVNKTGNPGMATAGTGDVLTGMIAAFLGQGLSAFDAAKYAAYLHGLAGDLAAKEKTGISLIATDIIDKLPEAIKKSELAPA